MNLRSFAFACGLVATASCAAAVSFEGTVAMKLAAGKAVTTLTYFFKGDGLRFESQPAKGPRSAGLLNGKTGAITVLMEEQKMYMTVGAPKKGRAADATFEATGRTETICGYACAEYVVREKKNIIEIWATSDLGTLPNLAEAFGNRGRRSAWETFAADKAIFALRVVTKDLKGKMRSTLECAGIEKKSLDDALFAIPADFTQLKMPGLGDLLGR